MTENAGGASSSRDPDSADPPNSDEYTNSADPPSSKPSDELPYETQISSIQSIFQRYDTSNNGTVLFAKIPELLQDLGRDAEKGEKVVGLLQESNELGVRATFEEVVQALKQVEQLGFDQITTPLGLLRRLEQYRKQCEGRGDYSEARRAKTKLDELKSKEHYRQKRLIECAQVLILIDSKL